MNETVEQTTKLLNELSILNRVEGRLLSDPESREVLRIRKLQSKVNQIEIATDAGR